MKKLLVFLLILGFAAPSFARRTDMMESYGFGNKSKKYSTNKKYNKSRYRYKNCCYGNYDRGGQGRYEYGYGNKPKNHFKVKKYKKHRRSIYIYKDCCQSDYYIYSQGSYKGDPYRSEIDRDRMRFKEEHYKNYMDRYRPSTKQRK